MAGSRIYSNEMYGPFKDARRDKEGNWVLDFLLADGTTGRLVRPLGDRPARKVRPGVRRPTGVSALPIARGKLVWESLLERDAMLYLMFVERVKSVKSQPFAVVYDDQRRTIETFPDIEAIHEDGTLEIIQIKTETDRERQIQENPRFRNERMIFQQMGWAYRVLTERTIQIEPRLSNLKQLRHYLYRSVDPSITASTLSIARGRKPAKVGEIVKALAAVGAHQADVIALIAQGKLKVDILKELTPLSEVTLPI
jgi:hypothetical protein